MTIFGVDIHPKFQAGISIEQIRREGFDWLAVKASQGTSTSWAAGARAWLQRGDACGLISFPYHYLTTADVNAQAQAAKQAAAGRPIMVDVEDGSGSATNLRNFLAACAQNGVRTPLVYLPSWYWQKIGSPSLANLPPLVSSRYRTATGYASAIYAGVPDSWWQSYGGGNVQVLQFSDRAAVAGQKIDVNAYRGTRDQFAALLGSGTTPPPPPPEHPTLRVGSTGGAVRTLQTFMNKVFPSYSKLVADGSFGPATEAVVKEFQRRVGITADGVVADQTWAKLVQLGYM